MSEPSDGMSTMDSGGSLEQWQHVIGQELCRVDIASPHGEAAFPARLSKRPFASGKLLRLDVPGHSLRRTATAIACDSESDISLVYVARGKLACKQFGRELILHRRDCFAIDASSPFEISTTSQSQCLTVRMPRSWVARHLQPEDISARRIDGRSVWGAALSAYLRALYIDFERDVPLSPIIMAEQALQLAQLALSGEFAIGSTHRKGLLGRIRGLMREVYHEEDLTPARMAAMANVSKTYMHRLFAHAGTTFCAELDALRISRAAALLESRSQRDLTINQIGIKCGLPDAPHFSRKFRALKGVTPSQYRQLRQQEYN